MVKMASGSRVVAVDEVRDELKRSGRDSAQ
jgi:hypothetical protein